MTTTAATTATSSFPEVTELGVQRSYQEKIHTIICRRCPRTEPGRQAGIGAQLLGSSAAVFHVPCLHTLPPPPHLFCSAVFRIPHLLTECVLKTPLFAGRFHSDACTDGSRSVPASPTFSSTCASASPANHGMFLVIYIAEGPAR